MIRLRFRDPTPGRGGRTFKLILCAAVVLGVGSVSALSIDLVRLNKIAESPGDVGFVTDGGTLMICGGGPVPANVEDEFIRLAGGRNARLLVIPTAHVQTDGSGTEGDLDDWQAHGLASVALFHARSRAEANDPEFVRPLADATAVWIGGGLQDRLTEVYSGTEVERQLRALLDRGGVIGGNSAGAAVMTRVAILDGRDNAVVGQGFDFFQGAVVDQHFLKRNRVRRLMGVVADHPDLVGFGIDERTALVVEVRTGRLHVIGNSYVMACIPALADEPSRFEILKRGDETDLASLRRPDGVIASGLDLNDVIVATH
ncbi:MAG: cyanophycinase [Isosphaeraceae bacterium]